MGELCTHKDATHQARENSDPTQTHTHRDTRRDRERPTQRLMPPVGCSLAETPVFSPWILTQTGLPPTLFSLPPSLPPFLLHPHPSQLSLPSSLSPSLPPLIHPPLSSLSPFFTPCSLASFLPPSILLSLFFSHVVYCCRQ